MQRRVFAVCLSPLALLLLAACGSDDESSPQCGIDDETIRQWILDPALPSEVVISPQAADAGAVDCAYHGFAWQELLYLTQDDLDQRPVFESWTSKEELFFDADPSPGIPADDIDKGSGVPADDTLLAASDVPLVDLNGEQVQFSVLVDDTEATRIRECELDRKGCFNTLVDTETSPPAPVLPNGSVELKVAWRRSPACDTGFESPACRSRRERFFVSRISIAGTPSWAEMVGFHVSQKTPDHSDWVWATFEHVDNAPDCADPTSDNDGAPWGFYRDDTACAIEAGDSTQNNCTANVFCAPCPDLLEPKSDDVPALTADQPCTASPHLYTAVDGTSCDRPNYPGQVCRVAPIDSSLVAPLNARVKSALRELGGRHAVWANYQLVGVLWTDSQSEEAGTIGLSNTTMETYLQNLFQPASDDSVFDANARSGCRVCHSFPNSQTPDQPGASVNGPILDYSFVFYALRSDLADTDGCSSAQPLPVCTAD